MNKKNKIKKKNIKSETKKMKEKSIKYILKNNFNYPNNFTPDIKCKEIKEKYNIYTREQLKKKNINKKVCGRIINIRIMGKASFCILKDFSGKIQIYISKKNIKKKFYDNHFKKWDLGDIIGVYGKIFKTNTKEITIKCKKLKLLNKIFRPIPNRFYGLIDKEKCYRRRHLDLISNEASIKKFVIRSKIIFFIRKFFHQKKFIEVETPIIQNIPGGASAKPFITYYNSFKKNMYLRISPELYLKKLIIGGFEKIFEINKSFRNEGISKKHNPEFTMIEAYSAYSNYEYMMKLIENLFKYILKKIQKNYVIKYKNLKINFKKKFNIITMNKSILKFNKDIKNSDIKDIKKLKKIAQKKKLIIKKKWNLEKLKVKIFEQTVEKNIIYPTFITHYPVETSPLAKRMKKKKYLTERFELFISGMEISNGFSELNNPIDQKKRFKKQIKNKKKNKNNFYDKEYINALEYGLPPTSGIGIGIDRIIMLLTNSKNIRDVILFPTLKDNV
ncbi:lysine--tRNA ligase [Buchnera aphidicola (Ceratoglyphina bambusae)]|uniref:lysine--tRNA ligase n=1 Tax=Buchnera aphidicola TaxID=9 RepID=UPI0031B813EC